MGLLSLPLPPPAGPQIRSAMGLLSLPLPPPAGFLVLPPRAGRPSPFRPAPRPRRPPLLGPPLPRLRGLPNAARNRRGLLRRARRGARRFVHIQVSLAPPPSGITPAAGRIPAAAGPAAPRASGAYET